MFSTALKGQPIVDGLDSVVQCVGLQNYNTVPKISCWNLSNLTVCDIIVLCVPGPEADALEKVCLRASELISCEWCSVRKLPVLFFQTSPEECVRLRTQLKMTRDKGGLCWYDCAGNGKDCRRYIVMSIELWRSHASCNSSSLYIDG